MDELIEKALNGQRRALARLISQAERDEAAAAEIVAAVYPHTGQAHIVGITGPPGSGKSTLVTAVAQELRQRGRRVGIVAVDPSSPFTGGALLGDRVRMRDLAGDQGVFMRSMASRGSLGGLARTTGAVIKILDAAGFETILVETVGAGQAEVDIATAAHTTLVVEAPGMGDDVQSIKAGILEIADILVVNKADRAGAAQTVKSLQTMLHLGPAGGTRHHGRILESEAKMLEKAAEEQAWQAVVLETAAVDSKGIVELVDKISEHYEHLKRSGQWLAREKERSRHELEQLLRERLLARFQAAVSAEAQSAMIEAVAQREMDVYAAVERLLKDR